jgi:hypothetical protein
LDWLHASPRASSRTNFDAMEMLRSGEGDATETHLSWPELTRY